MGDGELRHHSARFPLLQQTPYRGWLAPLCIIPKSKQRDQVGVFKPA